MILGKNNIIHTFHLTFCIFNSPFWRSFKPKATIKTKIIAKASTEDAVMMTTVLLNMNETISKNYFVSFMHSCTFNIGICMCIFIINCSNVLYKYLGADCNNLFRFWFSPSVQCTELSESILKITLRIYKSKLIITHLSLSPCPVFVLKSRALYTSV